MLTLCVSLSLSLFFSFQKGMCFFLKLTPSFRHIKGVAEKLYKTDLSLKMAGYLLHFVSIMVALHFSVK